MRAALLVALCMVTASGCWSFSPSQAPSGVDYDFNLDDDERRANQLQIMLHRPDGTRRFASHKFTEIPAGESWQPNGLNMTVRTVPMSENEHEFIVTLPDGSTRQFDLDGTNEHVVQMSSGERIEFRAVSVFRGEMSEELRNAILRDLGPPRDR